MPRYRPDGIKPTGIKGALGQLMLGPGNPLNGARVKRIRLNPCGSTACEMIEAKGAYAVGDRVTVGAGEFRRSR